MYIEEKPQYIFREWRKDEWLCVCDAGGISTECIAGSKIKAKKLAAYRAIVYLLKGAGIRIEDRQDLEIIPDFIYTV